MKEVQAQAQVLQRHHDGPVDPGKRMKSIDDVTKDVEMYIDTYISSMMFISQRASCF